MSFTVFTSSQRDGMLSELRTTLLDSSQPDSARSHAAFQLRTEGSYEAYTYVLEGLRQRENDPLLRHELAYIIGQMQHKDAWRALQLILEDESDEVIVRHECAEAIGALGVPDSLSVLEAFSSHHEKDIAETCQIAVDQIKCKIEEEASRISVFGGSPLVPLDSVTTKPNPYLSVDPAPPLPGNLSIQELRERLMDTSSSLFNRYRAMFSLRNLDSDASALALLDGFADKSPLFRHEVAFVLGQMQRACTAEGLFLFYFFMSCSQFCGFIFL